MIAMRLDGAAC